MERSVLSSSRWLGPLLISGVIGLVAFSLHNDITNANREIGEKIKAAQTQDNNPADTKVRRDHDTVIDRQIVALQHQITYLMKYAVTRPAP